MGCLHNSTEIIAASVATRQAVQRQRRDAALIIQAEWRRALAVRRGKKRTLLAGAMLHQQAMRHAELRAQEEAAVAATATVWCSGSSDGAGDDDGGAAAATFGGDGGKGSQSPTMAAALTATAAVAATATAVV